MPVLSLSWQMFAFDCLDEKREEKRTAFAPVRREMGAELRGLLADRTQRRQEHELVARGERRRWVTQELQEVRDHKRRQELHIPAPSNQTHVKNRSQRRGKLGGFG